MTRPRCRYENAEFVDPEVLLEEEATRAYLKGMSSIKCDFLWEIAFQEHVTVHRGKLSAEELGQKVGFWDLDENPLLFLKQQVARNSDRFMYKKKDGKIRSVIMAISCLEHCKLEFWIRFSWNYVFLTENLRFWLWFGSRFWAFVRTCPHEHDLRNFGRTCSRKLLCLIYDLIQEPPVRGTNSSELRSFGQSLWTKMLHWLLLLL